MKNLVICLVLAGILGALMACGDSEVEENCREFCIWQSECPYEAQAPNYYGSSFGDVDGCTSNCIQANEIVADYAPQCYDALWNGQVRCILDIPCEQYGEEDDIIENRCGEELEATEAICSEVGMD